MTEISYSYKLHERKNKIISGTSFKTNYMKTNNHAEEIVNNV